MIGIAVGAAIGVALLVGVISASTAGNTVTETRAGVGEGSVTGYNISSVHYVLNASNPTQLNAVTFSLDQAPSSTGSISIKLSSASTTWYSCTVSGTTATCATTSPQATLAEVTSLVVVAAQ